MTDDAELAARDRALAGLDVVLDDERLTGAIDGAIPHAGVRSAEATYVRYKPGMGCIVTCRLTLAGGELDAYVRLERRSSYGKLARYARKATAPSAVAGGAVMLPGLAAVLYPRPNDRRVAAMAALADDGRRELLLAEALPEHPQLWPARLQPVRWKPERRFVATLLGPDGPLALVKAYGDGYAAAARAAATLGARSTPRTPRCLARSRAAGFIVLDWFAGSSLATDMKAARSVASAGAALAELHALAPPALGLMTRDAELRRVLDSVDTVAALMPGARGTALRLAQLIALRLPRDVRPSVTHGDFSADQVLVERDRVALVDFDEAMLADPLRDLGTFVAALGRDVVAGRLTAATAAAAERALLEGYGAPDAAGVRVWTAAALLHLAPEPFRNRQPEWPAAVDELLGMARGLLNG
jgi:hypothetical protein